MTHKDSAKMKKDNQEKKKLLSLLKDPVFIKIEKQILDLWKKHDVFERLREQNKNGKHFVFYDGPITANNPMGVHHAWGRTLKDVYQRFNAMNGKHQRYQNGFDCQGLWLEVEVEKSLGLNSKKEIVDYGLEKFAKDCKARVNYFAEKITNQSIRLGQWMDWSNSYFTYDDYNIEHIWYFLKKCHEKGWIYRGEKVLPWCYRCGTSLSVHEQADSYQELTHKAVFIRLPVVGQENTYFLVWTTTPWTLTANVALAVNPDLEYLLVQEEQDKYVLAKGTEDVLEGRWEHLDSFPGSSLINKQFVGPFEELSPQKKIKSRLVVSWDEVTDTEGTGIVHIAPGCGAEDYELSKLSDLPVIAPIDEEARYTEEYDYLAGLNVEEAFTIIVKKLDSKGFLYKIEDYTHRYPVCWRCKTELVFKLEKEWFISSEEIRPKMLEVAQAVTWQPEHVGKAMENWLTNMGDWCISRKRYWGLPLPFYFCDCGHLTIIESKAELKDLAVQPSLVEQLPELHKPWIDEVLIHCPKCHNPVERIKEVGDCWLDAGIIPFSTLAYLNDENRSYWKEWFPAELVLEMKEQVRLWFYSLLFMSVTLENQAPYKTVVSYAELRDSIGNRFSKSSKTNVVFDEIVEDLGADILRWLFSSINLKFDLNFNRDEGKEIKRKLMTFFNIIYFLLSSSQADNLSLGEIKGLTTKPKDKLIDKWILAELNKAVDEIRVFYENYSVREVLLVIENFLELLSNWYVRLNRRRFWKNEFDGDKQDAYGTLYECVLVMSKLLAPILPFTTDFVYQAITSEEQKESVPSIHLCSFPVSKLDKTDVKLINDFELVKKVVSMAHTLRNKSQIRVRQPLSTISLWAINPENYTVFKRFKQNILSELNVKEMKLLSKLSQGFQLKIVLDYEKLGPKYKQDLRRINKEAEVYNQKDLKELFDDKQKLFFKLDDKTIVLEPDEYSISIEDREGFASIVEENIGVILDLNLTDELITEGYARDIVRNIQKMRQDLDLDITENILVAINFEKSDDDKLQNLKKYNRYISEETLAKELKFSATLNNPLKEQILELESQNLRISISRI